MKQELVVIVDRSGSMQGKEQDTIGGINSCIEEMKNGNHEKDVSINVSIKFFDHEEKMLIRHLDINQVRPLNVNNLKPRGQTALYDAMGNSISYFIEKKLKDSNAFDNCVIAIATDGMENSSRFWNCNNLKRLINEASLYNIQLLYLAANQDAILEAQKFGLSSDSAINYNENHVSVDSVYRNIAYAAKRHRSGNFSGFTTVERSASQR